MSESLDTGPWWLKRAGLFAGPALALLVFWLLPEAQRDSAGAVVSGLSRGGRATAAVAALMATWWLTEALPLEATSLLPIVLLPLLGITGPKAAAAPYASEVIFLFMGGLILGLSMERWGLHRRIALITIRLMGDRPLLILGGVMLATAVMSMWVSNTATAVMMLPIGVGIATLVEGDSKESSPGGRGFATCLMLAIAYAASIGGVGTLVGTPPNAVLAAVTREHGIVPPISFSAWLPIGLITAATFLPIAWLVLARVLYRVPGRRIPGLKAAITQQYRALGPMGRGEWATFITFSCTATLWVVREPLGRALGLIGTGPGGVKIERLTDAGIAIAGALVLFMIPVDARRRIFVMDWTTASRMPWGVLLLFGGGLSLADAITANGVDAWIGDLLQGMGRMPPLALILIVATVTVFLTEVTSNTAVATVFLAVMFGVSTRLGLHPYVLMIPTAIAASYAFMMPMGTPPNALVFATGRVNIRQMARAGLVLNLLAIILITVIGYWVAPAILGFDVN